MMAAHLLLPLCATALLSQSRPAPTSRPPADIARVYSDLLAASELLDPVSGRCVLRPCDVRLALEDMHLRETRFLPPQAYADVPVDVTEMVTQTLPRVLHARTMRCER